ncbi:MAG: hypothetical protein R2747_19700 [Pyrinomonadaceae bacterium]
MKKVFFLILLVLTQMLAVSAQKKPETEKVCLDPFSFKFSEFKVTKPEDLRQSLDEFKGKMRSYRGETKAYIFVYGGQKTSINEVTNLIRQTREHFGIYGNDYGTGILVYKGGYRVEPSVEIFIKPMECSITPEATPDFTVEQVLFAEAPKESTVSKTPDQILDSLNGINEIPCPAAARAVGFCNKKIDVFLIIDQEGKVIFSEALSGHPLLWRAGQEGVRSWKFKPTVIEGKKYNVVGRVTIEFKTEKQIEEK